MERRGIRYGICFGYGVFVGISSLMPSSSFGGWLKIIDCQHSDKIYHFIIYGILAVLIRWAVGGRVLRSFWAILLVCMIYGALMELGQLLFLNGDRYFSFGDMAANGIGSAVGMIIWHVFSNHSGSKFGIGRLK